MGVRPSASADPQVSIVVVTGDRHHRTLECMGGIYALKGLEDCEVLLIDGSPSDHSELYSRFRGLRYFHINKPSSLAEERLEAVRLARAPIVAFLEDHVVPEPGWLDAVRRAFARPEKIAMVNYAIAPSPSASYVYRALQMTQYGHWMIPARSGPIRYACLQNLAYRRELLTDLGEDGPDLFEFEFLLHRQFLRDGWTIWLAADAVIDHENYNNLITSCKGFGAMRQMIGAGRAKLARWPAWKRWIWAAGMPLAPVLLTFRLARSIAPRPALWGEFIRSLPIGIASQVWGAALEARGYLRGFEDSRKTFLDFESYVERTR